MGCVAGRVRARARTSRVLTSPKIASPTGTWTTTWPVSSSTRWPSRASSPTLAMPTARAHGHAATPRGPGLGIEHVLVDPGSWTVTGIIDWADAAVVDPAIDFGLLYRDLGPDATRAAMGGYRSEVNDLVTLGERAVFYARCSLLEDLAYGIQTGRDKYVDKSLAAMAWLFPA
jgi:Phosphotransferase enzyme family